MESTASTPPASTSGSRLLPPVPGSISSTPNTSESFRNVRPLQTAFASNGLVSKRRRGTMVDSKSEATVRYGAVDMERASSLDAVPKENSFHHPRPLREVVETAMAERSFSKKSVAVMPDTPVKPSFAMSEAASAARVHRRGRSMGGPFPSRSPLFPTPPRSTYFHAPGTEAPRARIAHSPTLAMGFPRSEGPRRHHRSASERVPAASGLLGHLLEEPRPAIDPNDVFEAPESPLRNAPPSENEYNLPSLKREQPVRRARTGHHTGAFPLPRADPMDEVPDTPMTEAPTPAPASVAVATPSDVMNSPNNCFASPLMARAPSVRPAPLADSPWMNTPMTRDANPPVLHTGSLYGSEASPSLALGELSPEEQTPITPTRKPPHLKWFEAAHAHSPSQAYGGTAARKHKVQRPRHSEPVDQWQTPPAVKVSAVAQSEPAHARYRQSTQSIFEDQFVTESTLGQGEFSEVVKVREKSTGHVSAVKRMKRAFLGPKDRIRRLEEVDVLCLLRQNRSTWHDPFFGADGVVDLLSAWEEDGFLYLQTELCPLGSLAFVLAEYGRQVGALDEARLWKVLAELAAGVDYIHKCGVLHLDLKPANILITEIGSLKITDFGMATRWPRCTAKEIVAGAHLETRKFLPRDGESASDLSFTPPSSPLHQAPAPWGLPAQAGQGTFAFSAPQTSWGDAPERPRRRGMRQHRKGSQVLSLEREGDREYIAPEVIFESKYGKPADIFSLGLILLEAACSVEIPDNGEPWHKLRCDDFSDVQLDTLSPAMQSVITALLSSQPYLRPTAHDLMQLPTLAVVRDRMRRGLKANELDQLPAFSAGTENGAPYPLPASKYYAPPASHDLDSERMVVRFRGAMIQEDEIAFMTEVLHAADHADHASPDTSTSLMTEDAFEGGQTVDTLLSPSACMPDTHQGMDIDKVSFLGDRAL